LRLDFAHFHKSKAPITILAEGYWGTRHAKTAYGVMRYGSFEISSIIDSKATGEKIVASIEKALELEPRPQALLLGIAPIGGQLPETWLQIIKKAIKQKMHIINGLHLFLNQMPELSKLAKENNVELFDLRDPYLFEASKYDSINKLEKRNNKNKIITMVGSDCNVGKMCTAIELDRECKRRNLSSSFLATGQTGIMIAGDGIPLDRIIGDFMAGATENLVNNEINKNDPEYIFVEGQGSLLHPAYSGVTLALMHGSNPDYMILCSKPSNNVILGGYDVKIPSFIELIEIYEKAASLIQSKNSKVIGIALNTSEMSENEAKELILKIQEETKLPVTDVIRYGATKLVDQVVKYANQI
jgi:uncharacterized NAD-dependent epimerase/dehydratase family protein